MHTTQFEIRKPEIGLYKPVLALAIDVMEQEASDDFIRVAGICGSTKQATTEAAMAKSLGYHAGLLSLAALKKATEDELISHCKAVADIIPVFGFYLQPAVGGRLLSYDFWRRFVELENMVAIKIATFNRYQTLDVIRAIAEAGKTQEIALYTGNDDNIVMDLDGSYVSNTAETGRNSIQRRLTRSLGYMDTPSSKKAAFIPERCRIQPSHSATLIDRGDTDHGLQCRLF